MLWLVAMQHEHDFFTDVEKDYPDCLRDESRIVGMADAISFPETEEDLKHQLAGARKLNVPVTLQGARTGITGGAVPAGGSIINFSRMNRIVRLQHASSGEAGSITVEPGVLLSEVREAIGQRDKAGLFFPPDPTEASASIGGMVACNASGARTFSYGSTRDYVDRLRVVLADGSCLDLRRGEQKARGREFSITTDTGREIGGALPGYEMPALKNAAGYFVRDDMDLLDLFVGSEGTLGAVSLIELRLISAPRIVWGVTAFLPSEEAAIRLVLMIRAGRAERIADREVLCGSGESRDPGLVAVEFFDCRALDLLRRQKACNPAFKEIPDMPPEWHTAVYAEYHGSSEDAVESAVMEMSEAMVECGGDEDATWLASDDKEMARLKNFRHAVPEAVNLLIDERRKNEPGLTKLGTDLAVPDTELESVMALYHRGLDEAGLEYVMFGHIGDNHVHVNIIPNDLAEYECGKQLYAGWAGTVVGMGGTVSAEHGIGKLKSSLLREMYGSDGLHQMQRVKELFDPDNVLNRGNLFSAAS